MSEESLQGPLDARGMHIALATVIGVAVIGYFAGIGAPEEREAPPAVAPAPSEVPAAASYGELRGRSLGPNAGWSSNLAVLAKEREVDPPLEEGEVRETALETALAERGERRAFDGAPPTIPHPVAQNQASECLVCHLHGVVVEGRVASPISHEPYTSCTQCHVTEMSPVPFKGGLDLPPVASGSDFKGLASKAHGERAYPGAPPQIPHATWMRQECASCHGEHGRAGMRSTHPERQSCAQCHAPSSERDQWLPFALEELP